MKVRVFATIGVLAASLWLLGGCAGTPTRPSDEFDTSSRPQMFMPGAVRSEVKGLAMGAAKAKGWTIVRSTDDRLVVQRPLDPASPTARALGAAGSAIPPMIEVTSAFIDQSGGVNVALGATLISQAPGDKGPKRTDYTENFRDALNQSLESLRANWSANSSRVANSLPPPGAHSELETAGGPQAAGASTNPLVQVWADALADETASKRGRNSAAATPRTAAEPTSPQPRPRATAPEPAAPVVAAAEPVRQLVPPEPTPAPIAAATPPRPQEASQPRGGAPVVDGSSAVGGRSSVTSEPRLLPPVAIESVEPGDNMLTLSQPSGTGTWAYYAEQYARLRGCNVTAQGAQLIETRADGEIHKVPCTGTDSYLLKCQNGVCRGLE